MKAAPLPCLFVHLPSPENLKKAQLVEVRFLDNVI